FDDLAVDTDVLKSYENIEKITFSTGLYVIDEGAYGTPDDNGAKIHGPNTVTMTIPYGTNMISFYFKGSAILKAYNSDEELVFQETTFPFGDYWSPYATRFNSAVYKVDFDVSSEDFLIDPLTNGGCLIPEPSTLLLLGYSLIGLAGIRIKKN
ncbi:PEP-CTERM sorting domain-containing protein, partial [Candidatus Desantisbacteria bacterium]|nr:PEP-CTERM sorting domain-containing protein [Candidatus Desantisbacteria bacterium]